MATNNETERHTRFIRALEACNMSWERMASDTGWTIDEVKLYAYEYMMLLNNSSRENDISKKRNDQATSSSSSCHVNEDPSQSNWTYDDCILFDTLVARYSSNGDEDEDLRWSKIASMLPGKTPQETRERYLWLKG
mmetsp:Transcript_40738/g.49590  ORF Transcript_40738/g.49590 Transcript_40738/m.49590 type:complete len:136 (+) Transcript_40738:97-504(+)|eukprot:CAMPEP_0172515336 /NCGR_PEP_ID=MMETSP1066-20121228/267326_1 /TAXON_ID=671091 /ORGANISM="Coscinodiscus wailesii, Strain CCMP2513" /LENGTH=135 /DNA_ID=CAMNT_0013296373 /DNA_START=95 /DNA_END=502 /DNA_ORIENTATION=+